MKFWMQKNVRPCSPAGGTAAATALAVSWQRVAKFLWFSSTGDLQKWLVCGWFMVGLEWRILAKLIDVLQELWFMLGFRMENPSKMG